MESSTFFFVINMINLDCLIVEIIWTCIILLV